MKSIFQKLKNSDMDLSIFTDYKVVRAIGYILFLGGFICAIIGYILMLLSQDIECGRPLLSD